MARDSASLEQAISEKPGVELVLEPNLTASSGKAAKIHQLNRYSITFLPTVGADRREILLMAELTATLGDASGATPASPAPLRLATTQFVPNGQTLLIAGAGPLPSTEAAGDPAPRNQYLLCLTPKIMEESGDPEERTKSSVRDEKP